jgi:hypothetical protein
MLLRAEAALALSQPPPTVAQLTDEIDQAARLVGLVPTTTPYPN